MQASPFADCSWPSVPEVPRKLPKAQPLIPHLLVCFDRFLLDHPESAETARPGTAPPAAEVRISGQRICDNSYRTQLVGGGIMITSEVGSTRVWAVV